ncbi:MAG: dihydroorotase [Desulfomicrobiaceae bacterium]|nr:dihydroorotase [Desulfomicrobiaceae bacterium]
MLTWIIRHARLGDAIIDLAVQADRIAAIAPAESLQAEDARVLEAHGARLLPSLIDAHVHLREPGFEYKEDIASGLAAALAGGFGQVMAMANTNPVNDSATVTTFMLERARVSHPHGPWLRPIGALTKGLAGQELAPAGELAEAGCVALSNDGKPVASTEILRRAMEYAADLGLMVIDHCEDPALGAGGGMNEGALSGRLGIKGIPDVSEAIQVARDVLLASYLHIPIHLAHISCRASVEIIAQAKAKGVPVTAETCPHYLVWDETMVEGYRTAAKVNPPLRTADDVLALREAVRTGVIDILATDHAPHAAHEKDVPFDEAPFGISGLDTALALTTLLVREHALSWSDAVRLWAEAPARIFRLPEARIEEGAPANFLLLAEDASWTVSRQTMLSKSTNTPALGMELPGRVVAHFLGGQLLFHRTPWPAS